MHTGFAALLVVHGLIHALGFLKAFGVAEFLQFTQPISRPLGLLWLAAAVLVTASAFIPARAFWITGALALVLSQTAIVSAWSDAKFGTLVNLVLLLAIAYSFASAGPFSFLAEYRRDTAEALRRPSGTSLVTEADLRTLPAPIQRYLRVTGSIGQPRIYNFRARWTGRIRANASAVWMPLRAEQLNTFDGAKTRLFHMTATMKHLPVDIYHRFVADEATFRVRLLSSVTVESAKGPELNRSETVTLLNDLCLFAPAALVDPALRWQPIDARSARVTFTRGSQAVRAELHFNEAGELIDFSSDDRSQASADGKSFRQLRWSTPVGKYRDFGARHIATQGAARWHAPEGSFAYIELDLEAIEYNVSRSSAQRLRANH